MNARPLWGLCAVVLLSTALHADRLDRSNDRAAGASAVPATRATARSHDDHRSRGDYTIFGDRDRHILRECLSSGSGLPPGLAKKDRLPPGLEKQLRRNGTLPPGLARQAHALPYACTVRLPRLPRDWERIILGGRILLLNPQRRIIDLFLWED